MNMLWTSNAMIDAMGGRPVGQMPEGVTGVTIDSRSVENGAVFFAIKGDNFANVSSVSFGEVPATSYTIVSNTEITAVVGIGASGEVVVVNTSGRGSLNGRRLQWVACYLI